jgi:hypothetical protein
MKANLTSKEIVWVKALSLTDLTVACFEGWLPISTAKGIERLQT